MVGLPSGACGGDLSSRVTELSNLYHLPFSMFRALISSLILHCLGKAAQIADWKLNAFLKEVTRDPSSTP